jgi:hypothetical protein
MIVVAALLVLMMRMVHVNGVNEMMANKNANFSVLKELKKIASNPCVVSPH